MSNPFDQPQTPVYPPTPAPAPSPVPASAAVGGNGGITGGIASVSGADPYSMAGPVGLSNVRMKDPELMDQLLLVEPIEHIASMVTSNGPSDAVRADIIPLTGPAAEQTQQGVLVFQEALKRELLTVLRGPDRYLVASLHLGAAKEGRSAPYLFVEATREEMEIVNRYVSKMRALAQQRTLA